MGHDYLTKQYWRRRNEGEIMPTPIILLLLLISILVFREVQSGNMKFTGKKFLLGLILTIVSINVIMFYIM
jgi:uncharacterized integral membrane protein